MLGRYVPVKRSNRNICGNLCGTRASRFLTSAEESQGASHFGLIA
jgi:hypothetical protein